MEIRYRRTRDGNHSGGGVGFIEEIRDELRVRVLGKSIVPDGEQHQLREAQVPYKGHFDHERELLRQKMGLEWDVYPDI